jgi:hypothetical protein
MISVPSKSKKKRKKKVDIEVYRRHILGIVHSLDGMLTEEMLKDSWQHIRKNAAYGIDRVSAKEYE